MKKIALVLLICISSSSLFAQECGTALKDKRDHSHIVIQEREAEIRSWIAANFGTVLRSTVTLPVVVHVLYRTSEQNITEDQILSQIEVLNDDFRLMNSNAQTIPTRFSQLAADIEMEFCLAKVDPDGNPTNGITRKEVDVRNIGATERFYNSARGGVDAWDVDAYINIWICEMGRGLLGFASLPDDPGDFNGIAIQPQYFGNIETAIPSFPNHLGRTMTHEMGHYLGLEHLWGKDGSNCDMGDFIEDTPPQEIPTYNCPQGEVVDICSPSNGGIMFNNYMDYTDDACMSFFTLGQKERMWAQMNLYRPEILNSEKCQTTSTVIRPEDILEVTWNNWTSEFCLSMSGEPRQLDLNVYTLEGVNVWHRKMRISEKTRLQWIPPRQGCYVLHIKDQGYLLKSTIFAAL